MPQVTLEQVRVHYRERGFEYRIAKNGHVSFRKQCGAWRDGGYVSDYRVVEGELTISPETFLA